MELDYSIGRGKQPLPEHVSNYISALETEVKNLREGMEGHELLKLHGRRQYKGQVMVIDPFKVGCNLPLPESEIAYNFGEREGFVVAKRSTHLIIHSRGSVPQVAPNGNNSILVHAGNFNTLHYGRD